MKWALIALCLATPATAEQATVACMPRDELSKALRDQWGEHSVFQGLETGGKSYVEIFARPDGSWTAVVVSADGTACPAAAGEIWMGFSIPQGEDS